MSIVEHDLSDRMRELGAPDPEVWAGSDVHEGSPLPSQTPGLVTGAVVWFDLGCIILAMGAIPLAGFGCMDTADNCIAPFLAQAFGVLAAIGVGFSLIAVALGRWSLGRRAARVALGALGVVLILPSAWMALSGGLSASLVPFAWWGVPGLALLAASLGRRVSDDRGVTD